MSRIDRAAGQGADRPASEPRRSSCHRHRDDYRRALPVFVAVVVPLVSGERLSDSSDLEIALEMSKQDPAKRDLDPEAAIQA